MNPPGKFYCRLIALFAGFCWLSGPAVSLAKEKVRSNDDCVLELIGATGIPSGLAVHVGCGDGTLAARLPFAGGFLVHGLDADAANVSKARALIRSSGLLGRVSIESFDGRRLPHVDNLVNVLVVDKLGDISMSEVMRVLAPRGVAFIQADGQWTEKVKAWPAEWDEWTHFLHDASNNAVSHDRSAAAPSGLRWIGAPLWSRSHEYDSSLSALVSAQGRLFCIFDEGPTGIADPRIPDRWMLIARDAFNGVVLWKRPIPDWGWTAWKREELDGIDWRRMPSQRCQVPLAAPRRLVAVGDRVFATLGYRAPLTCLEAATGKAIATYPGTEGTDEIVHDGGRLVLCIRASLEGPQLPADKRGRARREAGDAALLALDPNSGRHLWRTEPGAVIPLSPSAAGGKVFYHDRDAVVCLDAATGALQWRKPASAAANSIWSTDTTLLVRQDVVLCANVRQLIALSAADGSLLWSLRGAKGFGAVNPPDLFVVGGVVWYGEGDLHASTITGYDLRTGKPARKVDMGGVITRGHHARCYRSRATENYLLLPKRGVEFIDLRQGRHSRNNWVRGACRYGVLPCNGLLYSTPHPCFCYAGVKLGGFLALTADSSGGSGQSDAETGAASSEQLRPPLLAPKDSGGRGDSVAKSSARSKQTGRGAGMRLERGPAYEPMSKASPGAGGLSDWPMYRHDPQRSGATSAKVGAPLEPLWQSDLGGKLTQPVIAGGRLFAARVDAGQVCCLDAATGKPVWDFVVGARVDSAPTFHRGRLIFGSADGAVYCLRANDGELAWRFQAEPQQRRVAAFGQIESAWPVHGSVLMLNNTAYFTAGRSSYLDGGIIVYGLDPLTGRTLYKTRLDGPRPDTTLIDENAYAMEGAKSDVLVTDGKLIYLFHNAFNERLERQPTPIKGEPGVRNLGERDFPQHLFSNAGFLDDSGFNRSYWMYGDCWPAFNFAHQSPKAGQLVVFDDAQTYAVQYFVRRNLLSPLSFPATDGYYLFADRNDSRPVLVRSDGKEGPAFMRWLPQTGELQTCWNLGVGFARAEPAKWINVVPVRIRAMVRTGDALYVAGPPDECDPDDPTAALEGRRGAVLMAFDPADGTMRLERQLDAPPVFDGMAAAGGRLYISTTAGRVDCFGQPTR